MSYVTKSGDTWDIIAKAVYGNELRADILMAANRSYIDIFMFDSGVVLSTPELSQEESGYQVPPWKR